MMSDERANGLAGNPERLGKFISLPAHYTLSSFQYAQKFTVDRMRVGYLAFLIGLFRKGEYEWIGGQQLTQSASQSLVYIQFGLVR